MLLTPTYHVFEMYKAHQDATLLPLDLQCAAYQYGDQAIPALSASASRDQGGQVHLSLCNLDPHQPSEVTCELRGTQATHVTGRVLTADAMNAHNPFGQPEMVRPLPFNAAFFRDETLHVQLPAKSVVVLEM
jgi:alpha-N-arabinofuranosidase